MINRNNTLLFWRVIYREFRVKMAAVCPKQVLEALLLEIEKYNERPYLVTILPLYYIKSRDGQNKTLKLSSKQEYDRFIA